MLKNTGFFAAGLLLSAFCVLGARAESLTIGMTQFPSNFHPAIDSMLAKTLVLAATRRPFVVHDQEWQPVCLLCSEFPTLENGLARLEAKAGGSLDRDLVAWLEGDIKYIVSSKGRVEAYDIRADPDETAILELSDTAIAAAQAKARAWWEANVSSALLP